MSPKELQELATQLLAGSLSVEEFVHRAALPHTADVGHAKIDLDRHRRCGFPEVVFAQGKTVAALEEIFCVLVKHGADVFSTRMSEEQYALLKDQFPTGQYNPVARTFRIPKRCSVDQPCFIHEEHQEHEGREVGDGKAEWKGNAIHEGTIQDGVAIGRVTIVTAGTTDLPVAEEARETAVWTGARVTMIQDVGVAGPHRLTANLPLLREADAVVVVAGMEGALPSVVGGHVACPVIAVPTSVGYGAAFGGVAALLGMLNSCASNVTVVNIDAGFKGGYVAGLIAKNMAKARVNRPARAD